MYILTNKKVYKYVYELSSPLYKLCLVWVRWRCVFCPRIFISLLIRDSFPNELCKGKYDADGTTLQLIHIIKHLVRYFTSAVIE